MLNIPIFASTICSSVQAAATLPSFQGFPRRIMHASSCMKNIWYGARILSFKRPCGDMWKGLADAHGSVLQANVKEPQYNVGWFKGFDLVLNGLDNLDARRHVNRLCLAAEVPLVESGTAAYLGQVCSMTL